MRWIAEERKDLKFSPLQFAKNPSDALSEEWVLYFLV